MIIPLVSFFTLAFLPESACANIPIKDFSAVVPSSFPKLIVPLFLAVCPFPLFLANIPTVSLFSNRIFPLGAVFSPFPVSDTKIPTPFSASTSISLLFLTSPESFAYIPIDFLAVDVIAILALFVAVETSLFEFFPSANIPTPSSAFKLIPYSFPETSGSGGSLELFSIFDPSLANIPIDFTLFTLMIPSSLFTAVEFFLANIPIFSLLLVVEPVEAFKVITPVFSAITLAFATFVESFINIIPTDDSLSTSIAFLLNNVNFEAAVVTEESTFPSIPTDFSFFTSISPFVVSVLLSAISLVPTIFLSFVNSTNIPAESFPSIVIFFLFVALLFLAYIAADPSFLVVIEATKLVLVPVFSILASSPYIPADCSSSIRIVPLFIAEALARLVTPGALTVLTNIPTDFFFLVVIVPVKLLLSSRWLITVVFFGSVSSVVPNIPTDFSSSNKIIFLFVKREFSPAIPIESVLVALILPSLVKIELFLP